MTFATLCIHTLKSMHRRGLSELISELLVICMYFFKSLYSESTLRIGIIEERFGSERFVSL